MIISISVAALIALGLLVTIGLCYCIYKYKFRNAHSTDELYCRTISTQLDPNVHPMRTTSPPIQNELSVNSTEQEPEYLSLIAPSPLQENITPVNDTMPRSSSFTNIRMTSNTSYIPVNIHTINNEAYGVLHNASSSTNVRVDCGTVVDQTNANEGATDNGVALITGSYSKIGMTSDTSYIGCTPDAIHTTQNEVYGLVQNTISATTMKVADSSNKDKATIASDVVPGTSSLSDIRITKSVSGDSANVHMTCNNAYRLVHNVTNARGTGRVCTDIDNNSEDGSDDSDVRERLTEEDEDYQHYY